VAIRCNTTLEASEAARRGNHEAVLCSPAETAARFPPAAVRGAVEVADRCRFDLTHDLGYSYPDFAEGGEPAGEALARICRDELERRYAGSASLHEARARLAEELRLIERHGLAGFFLLHRDILEMAREVAVRVRGRSAGRHLLPPGRGRGSSVGSIVCYLIGLSHVDPIAARLFLGRFLSEELASVPDIDLDFPRDVREGLMLAVVERYGPEHAALVAAFPTYRVRGAVRDLGKALALPQGEVERMARLADEWGAIGQDQVDQLRERAGSPRWRAFAFLMEEIMGIPRHISQHSGGMVISTRPLVELVPVIPAAMEGRQICQWDKDSCADAGFLKIDLLGLGMLSAVEECVDLIAETRGAPIDLSRVGFDDPAVYAEIQQADTVGVFQIESRAQMQSLHQTLPENLNDLTVQVALVRPGPIQGGAVHPYIERRKRQRRCEAEGREYEIPYEHELLEHALEETLGTIVYQEQVLEVAIDLADFNHAEAEKLRRAMSRKRSRQAIDEHRDRFLVGAVGANEVPLDTAERVWEQIQGFAGFGFPKAHSAAFGLLAYQSAWLRVHRREEFLCALLNEQPMGFYPPDALVQEARRREILIAPPDVNRSQVLCHVETSPGLTVRIGLGYVKGVRAEEMEMLVAERERGGGYGGIADLASRSGLGGGPGHDPGRGHGERRGRRRAPRGALAGRRQRQRPRRPQGDPAGAAGRAAAGAAAATAGGLGGADRRLPLDRDRPRQAPDGADAPGPRPGPPAQRPARAGGGRQRGRGGRHGRRPPAPRDRQRDRLHDPGRRAWDRQRDRPQARLRTPPRHRPRRRDGPCAGPAGAPRRRRQRPRRERRAA
jgi:error-prone DNA polymerase